jgi:hypothetical protein
MRAKGCRLSTGRLRLELARTGRACRATTLTVHCIAVALLLLRTSTRKRWLRARW